jgi:hypothetical protein
MTPDTPGPDSEAMDLLRILVATPSISGSEGAIADVVHGWLHERGVTSNAESRSGRIGPIKESFDGLGRD